MLLDWQQTGQENDHSAQIGLRAKIARMRANLSQPEASERVGVSTGTLSRYETGKRPIPLATLRNMANVYGCALGDFLGEGELLESNVHTPHTLTMIPILGFVSAGNPRDAWEVDLGVEAVPERLLLQYPGLFALYISGDSLSGDSINDGDTVYVDPNGALEQGQIYRRPNARR